MAAFEQSAPYVEKLSVLSKRQCQTVELRFFGGLTIRETAYVLGVSTETVKLDWRMARAWLSRELHREAGPPKLTTTAE